MARTLTLPANRHALRVMFDWALSALVCVVFSAAAVAAGAVWLAYVEGEDLAAATGNDWRTLFDAMAPFVIALSALNFAWSSFFGYPLTPLRLLLALSVAYLWLVLLVFYIYRVGAIWGPVAWLVAIALFFAARYGPGLWRQYREGHANTSR